MNVWVTAYFIFVCIHAVTAVKCYSGAGAMSKLKDCGTASTKCINATINDMVMSFCFNDMAATIFKASLPGSGCLLVTKLSGKICVCVGDGCNADTSVETPISPTPPKNIATSVTETRTTPQENISGSEKETRSSTVTFSDKSTASPRAIVGSAFSTPNIASTDKEENSKTAKSTSNKKKTPSPTTKAVPVISTSPTSENATEVLTNKERTLPQSTQNVADDARTYRTRATESPSAKSNVHSPTISAILAASTSVSPTEANTPSFSNSVDVATTNSYAVMKTSRPSVLFMAVMIVYSLR